LFEKPTHETSSELETSELIEKVEGYGRAMQEIANWNSDSALILPIGFF
jgi:hypothetical protein